MSLLNRRVRLGLSAAGAVAVLTISSTLAYAEPTTVDEAKAQLQRLEQEASEIDQQYAAVQAKVELRTSQLATARKDVDAQAGKVQALRSQVGQMALQQFKSRGVDTTTVLLTTDDAASFLNQLSTMHKVNENANVLLQDFQTEQANLSDMQRAADAELASISADQKQLGELSAQSDVKVKAAQAVLDRLTEEQRRKLAEQQAAEADRAADAARVARAATAATTAPAAPAAAAPVVSGSASSRAQGAVAFALAQVGDAYVMGASGPNAYDCSGLTSAAYRSVGVSLPRTSQSQYGVGQAVSLSQLQPGDLVFYYSGISHVGMYIGGGRIVDAANPRAGVRTTSVTSMPFMGGRRVA